MLLNYQQFNVGKGIPLVVIHGLFGASDNWRSHILRWSEERHIISLDLRNHGRSFHAETMSYQMMADDVVALLKHLNISQAHFLGHSMGGKVVMQLGLHYADMVSSLIIADIAPIQYAPRHDDIFAGLKAVDMDSPQSRKQGLEILASYIDDARICQFLIKSLYRNEAGDFAWRFNLDAVINEYLVISSAIQGGRPYLGPVLVLKGGASSYILPEHRQAFGQIVPNAELKVMSDCGHWLHAEKPDLFVRLVSRFINSLNLDS